MENTIPNANGMYEYRYPRPAVTADVLVFSADRKEILLIRRKNDPYKGCWAFPGGFLNIDETLEQCALRELQEETSLVLADIHPVGTYSTVDRDPRGRVITTAYYTSVDKNTVAPHAADDAAEIGWFSLDSLPPLAFDHDKILADAILLVRN
jgi:8-oxo-dGTP diphosphatase